MSSFLGNVGATLTGTLTDDEYNKLPQQTGPNAASYQIPGLQDYQNTQQGLANTFGGIQNPQDNTQVQGQSALPGVGDYTGANAAQLGQQNALQQYLQSIAMGHGTTAADQMLQNAQVQAARGQQSNLASMGGMNPALGMRGMLGAQAGIQGNLAGQAAQQKLQEQENFGQMAGGLSQAITGQQTRDIGAGIQNQNQQFQAGQQQNQQRFQQQQQQFQNAQQNFQNQMARTQAQSDIANRIFESSARQTSFSTELDQNRMAFQNITRLQAQQHAQDMARAQAAMLHGIATGVGTAAGGIIGGLAIPGLGAAPGAMAGGALLGGLVPGGGGGGGMDPALLALLARGGGQQPDLAQQTRTAAGQTDMTGAPTVGDYYGAYGAPGGGQ